MYPVCVRVLSEFCINVFTCGSIWEYMYGVTPRKTNCIPNGFSVFEIYEYIYIIPTYFEYFAHSEKKKKKKKKLVSTLQDTL